MPHFNAASHPAPSLYSTKPNLRAPPFTSADLTTPCTEAAFRRSDCWHIPGSFLKKSGGGGCRISGCGGVERGRLEWEPASEALNVGRASDGRRRSIASTPSAS
eukprot:4450093-Prymnesium_polylepis.1